MKLTFNLHPYLLSFFCFLLFSGTTFVVKENGVEVGRWEESDGKSGTQILDQDMKRKSAEPVAPSEAAPTAEGKDPATISKTDEKLAEPKIAAPADSRASTEMTLPLAMKGVPFIVTYDEQGQMLGGGSGALINSNGTILTNYHVIQNAKKIAAVMFEDIEKFGQSQNQSSLHYVEARLIKENPYYDLALMDINVENANFFKFADEKNIFIGSDVQAIGNPQGLAATVTKGIISAMRTNKQLALKYQAIPRYFMNESQFERMTWIQTDASINSGNSGGPLLNANFELIGINSFGYRAGADDSGLNFALHIKHVKEFAGGYEGK